MDFKQIRFPSCFKLISNYKFETNQLCAAHVKDAAFVDFELAIVNNMGNCEQSEIKSQFFKLFTLLWLALHGLNPHQNSYKFGESVLFI